MQLLLYVLYVAARDGIDRQLPWRRLFGALSRQVREMSILLEGVAVGGVAAVAATFRPAPSLSRVAVPSRR